VTRHGLVGRHSQWRGIRGFRGGDENVTLNLFLSFGV
jgi:hypothetical protein